VQVEGVSRALDPHHDMWSASRPIVERWVKRELGAEGVARRAIDEAASGFNALRRAPQTLAALEAAALAMSAAPTPAQRNQFHWMPFWVGFAAGAVAMLLAMAGGTPKAQKAPEPPAAEQAERAAAQPHSNVVTIPPPAAGSEAVTPPPSPSVPLEPAHAPQPASQPIPAASAPAH
jgi:ubiquinone biosynthesis protein